MVDTTLDIYKQNVPLGFPVIQKDTWNVSLQPEIKVEPADGYILFIKNISFLMTDTFELSGADAYLRVEHSEADGTNVYTRIDFAVANELLAMCDASLLVEHPSGTPEIIGSFCFHPPIRCRSSQDQYFTIIEEGTLTVAGEIQLTVNGWQMLETDFDGT